MKLKSLIFALIATTVATTAHAEISYQHIRNATAKIEMAGSTFLVDPYLAPKGSYAGFEGTINSQKRNPLIDMKEPVEKVLEGVDAVIGSNIPFILLGNSFLSRLKMQRNSNTMLLGRAQ